MCIEHLLEAGVGRVDHALMAAPLRQHDVLVRHEPDAKTRRTPVNGGKTRFHESPGHHDTAVDDERLAGHHAGG